MDEPKYKRVLLKISGEALAGDKHFGLDFQVMGQVADVIKECVDMGVQVGLVVGGVLTRSVWDRSYTELEERPTDEDTRTGMPRFRSFAAAEMLPTMLVMYLVISLAIGGREMAVQYLL